MSDDPEMDEIDENFDAIAQGDAAEFMSMIPSVKNKIIDKVESGAYTRPNDQPNSYEYLHPAVSDEASVLCVLTSLHQAHLEQTGCDGATFVDEGKKLVQKNLDDAHKEVIRRAMVRERDGT